VNVNSEQRWGAFLLLGTEHIVFEQSIPVELLSLASLHKVSQAGLVKPTVPRKRGHGLMRRNLANISMEE